MTDYYGYPYIALTGGSDGALDSLDGSVLKDGDFAVVVVPGTSVSYIYTLDEDSGASESSPDVIAPDANAGDKRWILSKVSTDAGVINYLQSGTGAVTRLASDRLKERISAADFGMLPAASAAVNAAALQAAIDSIGSRGGEVYIPSGTYNVASDVISIEVENITLTGAGSAWAYDPGEAGTFLVFGSGTLAIDLSTIQDGPTMAGNYTCIRDLQMYGNSVCANGLKINGIALLERIEVTGFTSSGIWLNDYINMTHLENVSVVGNGYGLFIGQGANSENTICSFNHVNARDNTVGIRIQNIFHAVFRDCVIESNAEEGMEIYRPDGDRCNYITFDNCWFEANYTGGTASDFSIVIDSETHNYTMSDTVGPPTNISFRRCTFYAPGSTKAVYIAAAIRTCFYDCSGVGNVVLGAYATGTRFYNWQGGTIEDSGSRTYQDAVTLDGYEGGGYEASRIYANNLCITGGANTTATNNGTAATVYEMPASNQVRFYQVFCKLATATGNASAYSAYALVSAENGTTRIMHQVDGNNLALTVSGMNIQATQTSGVGQNVSTIVTPFFGVE